MSYNFHKGDKDTFNAHLTSKSLRLMQEEDLETVLCRLALEREGDPGEASDE